MVSTRSVRYKFTEGERVLCYEPDPTKAKVLYDSKVLEVIESKDKRGRRTVEYLIHFQGWNSSWDRCVSEDFVLKDTEENRQLQRDLAEKSQLQLGAYLYRRERKKGSISGAGPGPAKRSRQGFSDDGSSSSTQPDEAEGEAEGGVETGDTDSSSGSSGSRSQRTPPPHVPLGRAQIILPAALRDRLTFDYHLVVKRGRLSRLPAAPCAALILESFVKWFARAGAWRPPRPRQDVPHKPDLLDVSGRLNLVREVADGLRVYFDFILRGHLLYKQEFKQYHQICGQFLDEQEERIKQELEDDDHMSQDEGDADADGDADGTNSAEEDLKSPKIPEYSHLPPDPEKFDEYHEQEDIKPPQIFNGIIIKQEIKEEPVDDIEDVEIHIQQEIKEEINEEYYHDNENIEYENNREDNLEYDNQEDDNLEYDDDQEDDNEEYDTQYEEQLQYENQDEENLDYYENQDDENIEYENQDDYNEQYQENETVENENQGHAQEHHDHEDLHLSPEILESEQQNLNEEENMTEDVERENIKSPKLKIETHKDTELQNTRKSKDDNNLRLKPEESEDNLQKTKEVEIQPHKTTEEEYIQQENEKDETELLRSKDEEAQLPKAVEEEINLHKAKEQEMILKAKEEQEMCLKAQEEENKLHKVKEEENMLRETKQEETTVRKAKENEMVLRKPKEHEVKLQKTKEDEIKLKKCKEIETKVQKASEKEIKPQKFNEEENTHSSKKDKEAQKNKGDKNKSQSKEERRMTRRDYEEENKKLTEKEARNKIELEKEEAIKIQKGKDIESKVHDNEKQRVNKKSSEKHIEKRNTKQAEEKQGNKKQKDIKSADKKEELVVVKKETLADVKTSIIKMEIKQEPEEEERDSPDENLDFVSEVRRRTRPLTRRGNVARRLRSHRSTVSQSESEEPLPSTSSAEPRTFEAVGSSICSSGSSRSEGWPQPARVAPTRTPLSLLLEKVAKWQIIPREGTEHLPCRVYGAIHLARLFVRLPDFLNATQMPDFKLKLIVKHIDMFVQYLEEHSEWFGETYYFADSASRST